MARTEAEYERSVKPKYGSQCHILASQAQFGVAFRQYQMGSS
ncbi:hypothetical protein ACFOOQ_19610 [Ferrovibrio xuzhouensis]|uniref:Transposase n=1 Tax=Ferrovibrio xuzhouensis TaxID=1576914 RepID=A0ABV7VK33_9PROT